MNDEILDGFLIYCLDELEAGTPLEEILNRYPDQADQIRPLLEMAMLLSAYPPQPSAEAQSTSQDLFLTHAKVMKEANKKPRSILWWRRLSLALGVLVIIFLAFLFIADGTASALPGSTLYSVKRSSENFQLNLTGDDMKREALLRQFEAERVREINTLLAGGNEAEVTCTGLVGAIDERSWIVCGLEVIVNEETVIASELVVGSAVKVEGVTRNGRFIATRIEVQNAAGEQPLILPTSAPTVDPPPTAVGVETPSPAETPPPLTDDEGGDDGEDADDPLETPEPEEPEEIEDEDNSGSGSGSGDEDEPDENNSGSGSGSGDEDEPDEDNSGSGSGSGDEDEPDEDNSGSGSGSGDEDEPDEDNSGSGSGSGDEDEPDEDNSGSGSGSGDEDEPDEDNSGSGSSN